MTTPETKGPPIPENLGARELHRAGGHLLGQIASRLLLEEGHGELAVDLEHLTRAAAALDPDFPRASDPAGNAGALVATWPRHLAEGAIDLAEASGVSLEALLERWAALALLAATVEEARALPADSAKAFASAVQDSNRAALGASPSIGNLCPATAHLPQGDPPCQVEGVTDQDAPPLPQASPCYDCGKPLGDAAVSLGINGFELARVCGGCAQKALDEIAAARPGEVTIVDASEEGSSNE